MQYLRTSTIPHSELIFLVWSLFSFLNTKYYITPNLHQFNWCTNLFIKFHIFGNIWCSNLFINLILFAISNRWNNCAWSIVVYLHGCAHLFSILLDMEKMRSTAVWKNYRSQLDDGISFSEKRISQRALAAKNGPRIVKRRWRSHKKVNYFTSKKR